MFSDQTFMFMSDCIFAVGSICQGEVHYTSSRLTQSQQEERKVNLQSFKSAPQRWWYDGGTVSGGSGFQHKWL